MRRTHSLIHRGYLYAQKRVQISPLWPPAARSELRMIVAKAHKDGYLQARRDAKKAR